MKFPVLLLLLALSLIGCDSGRSALPFTLDAEDEGPIGLHLAEQEPGHYLLDDPLVVTEANRAFFLRYRGGGSGSIVKLLGGDGRAIAAKVLPGTGESEVYIPLERGQILHGFRVDRESAPSGPPAPADSVADSAAAHSGILPELLEAGIRRAISALSDRGGHLSVGTGVRSLHRDGTVVELELAPPEPAASGWQIALRLETRAPLDFADFRLRESLADPAGAADPDGAADPEGAGSLPGAAGPEVRRAVIRIHLSSGDDSLSLSHSALQGRHDLFLYQGVVPFTPESLRIEPVGGAAFRMERFEIARLPLEADAGSEGGGGAAGSALHPLPADPGAVLLYDPQAWRQPQYELFSWSRFPEILIMDTASYAVQSRFFKRLAFFVEKPGYRGRLVGNREFAGLHGFNAHDYRAEDLARFFQTARTERFPLNPEEELLKNILLANGTISEEGGTFTPGKGGILSISRSSYPMLRRHLLSHECTHGMFFSLPEFRQASFEAWDRLSESEKSYWKLLFRWVGYDTEDPYLTVNEYQAYLFQQPREGVRYYFSVLTPSRLVSSYPAEAGWIGELVRSDPERFTRAFDHLEKALVMSSGVEGGRVIELELAENK